MNTIEEKQVKNGSVDVAGMITAIEVLLTQAINLIQVVQQQQAVIQPVKQEGLDETLDVRGAAALIKMSEWTVRDMVRRSEIPHRRIRSRILFSQFELREWLKEQATPVRKG